MRDAFGIIASCAPVRQGQLSQGGKLEQVEALEALSRRAKGQGLEGPKLRAQDAGECTYGPCCVWLVIGVDGPELRCRFCRKVEAL